MNNIKVTEKELKYAVEKVIEEGYTSRATLGASGSDFVLYGDKRCSSISVRLHSTGVELLICNKSGDFLFYGKFHPTLGADFIANRFYLIIGSIGYNSILSDSVDNKNNLIQSV